MLTAAGGSGLMMKSRWKTLLAAFYAALAQVLNEVYGKVIFSLAPVEKPPSFPQSPSQVRPPFQEAALLLKAKKLFPKKFRTAWK